MHTSGVFPQARASLSKRLTLVHHLRNSQTPRGSRAALPASAFARRVAPRADTDTRTSDSTVTRPERRATRNRAQKRTPRRRNRPVRVRFHAHAAPPRAETDTRRAVSPFSCPNKRARHGPACRSGRAGAGAGLLAPDADSALSHESDEQSSYVRDTVLV